MAPKNIKLQISPDLLICNACGTQYPLTAKDNKTECKICDDPRQFVPAEGQTFTTLGELGQTRRNVWKQDKKHGYVWTVQTVPSFAIGNRAELIRTTSGKNVLFDLIPFLDQDTVDKVVELGGLEAIIISHPHYYSTWADWSRTFQCPVFVGVHDQIWLERWVGDGDRNRDEDESGKSEGTTTKADLRFLTDSYTQINLEDRSITGLGDSVADHDDSHNDDNENEDERITAIIAGGHFPGSLLLHYTSLRNSSTASSTTTTTTTTTTKESNITDTYITNITTSKATKKDDHDDHDDHNEDSPRKRENLLFLADTIVTVPSATNPIPGKKGVISFSFFWSIPNRIPLRPDEVHRIWKLVDRLEYETCFGAFAGMDVYTLDNERDRGTGGVKGRLFESCRIFVNACRWSGPAGGLFPLS